MSIAEDPPDSPDEGEATRLKDTSVNFFPLCPHVLKSLKNTIFFYVYSTDVLPKSTFIIGLKLIMVWGYKFTLYSFTVFREIRKTLEKGKVQKKRKVCFVISQCISYYYEV